MQAWDAAAQGRRRAAGYTQARKTTSQIFVMPFFYLAGIDESNGEIFTNRFLVRLERQLYGLEDDRKISMLRAVMNAISDDTLLPACN